MIVAKIREAQKMQVPYMLVVGDREMEENTVSLRKRDGSKVNDLPFAEFVELLKDRYESRYKILYPTLTDALLDAIPVHNGY